MKNFATRYKMYALMACIVIIFSCSKSIKRSDIIYEKGQQELSLNINDWKASVGMMQGGASCVAIGLKNNKTVLATADHVMRNNPKFCVFDNIEYPIIDKICHPSKDICFFLIGEKVHYTTPKYILDSKMDVVIGFVKKQKTVTNGRAVPGQSGGGVFDNNNGLYAIVSTTGTGVLIIPALQELNIKLDD